MPEPTPARRFPAMLQTLFRLPVPLFRSPLARLLGHRFLLLEHRGRRSGTAYAAVLEVLQWDGEEAVVLAGLGGHADWLRNIEANRVAVVTLAGARFPAAARRLPAEQGAVVLADYERRHRMVRPVVRRLLARLSGTPYEPTPAGRQRIAGILPLIGLRRRPCEGGGPPYGDVVTDEDVLDELLDLERRGWDSLCDGTGADFYGRIMTEDAVMVLANGQVMDRDTVVAALAEAPTWQRYDIREPRVVGVGPGGAALVYDASADRGTGEPPFTGLMSSVYVRSTQGWRLALYQQTRTQQPAS